MKGRKRLKRVLRIAAWTLAGIVFIVLVFHTPPARNIIKGLLSRNIANRVEGEFSVGEVRYNLLRGEAELSDLELISKGLNARAERVAASFSLRDGITLRIERPRVIFTPVPAVPRPKREAPSYPWMILQQLKTLEVIEGRFEWGGHSSGTMSIQGSLALGRQDSGALTGEQNWSLNGDLECSFVEDDVFALNIKAALAIEQNDLHIKDAQIETAHTSISTQGTLAQSGPLRGNLTGNLQVSEALARSFGFNLPLKGTVTARFQVGLDDSGLNGRAELESPRFFIVDSGPWVLRAASSFDGNIVHAESLILSGYSGSLESQGSVNFKRKEIVGHARVSGLDPYSLISTWTQLPVPLASQVGGDVEFSLKNWRIDRIEAEVGFQPMPDLRNGFPLRGNVKTSFGRGKPEKLKAQYDLALSLSELPRVLEALEMSFPDVSAEGNVNVSGSVSGDLKDFVSSLELEGKDLRIDATEFDLSAEMSLDRKKIEVKAAEITLGSGRIAVKGDIPLGQSSGGWDISAKLHSLDLSEYAEKLGLDVSVSGRAGVKGSSGQLAWNADLHTPFRKKELPSQQGVLSLKARGSGDTIECEELKIELGSGTLTASGKYQGNPQYITGKVSGSGFRLEGLQPYADLVNGLEGNIGLDADFQGTLASPDVQLVLNFDQLSLRDTAVPDLSFSVKTDGETAELKGFAGAQFLSGHCLLKDSFPLQLTLDLAALPIQDMLSAFPDLTQVDVTSAQGTVQIAAPLRNPLDMKYLAEVDAIEGTYTQRVWSVGSFAITGDLESFLVTGFNLRENRQSLEMDGRIPLKADGDVDLALEGDVGLDLISQFIPQIELEGKAQGQLQIQGTRRQPQITGEAIISDCRGRWRNFSWENLEARVSGSEDELRLDSFSMRFLDGTFEANGYLTLTESGINSRISYQFDQVDTGILLFGRELETIPSIRVSGKGEITASELTLAAVVGSGTISSIEASRGGLEVSLENPVDWRMEKGYFSHTAARIIGEGIDLRPVLVFDASKSPLEWKVEVQGLVQPVVGTHFFDASNLRLSGETKVKLELGSKDGELTGRISTEGGRVDIIDPDLSVSTIQTQLSLQNETFSVTEIKGEVGSGSFSVSGQLSLDEASSLPKADLSLTADNVPYVISDGIYGQFSGDLQLLGDSENYVLRGDIIVPRILVRRELDAASQSLAYLERELIGLEGGRTFVDRISLDLRAEVQELQIKNALGELLASGVLNITGSPSLPELDGNLSTLGRGQIDVGRARIEITDGRLTLVGFPDNPPDLNVTGITRVSGVTIEVRINGKTDNLQTQFLAPGRSDLTQGDMVLLIMTGRTTSDVGSDAGAIVAEELADNLGEMLQKRSGDKVYIDVAPDPSYFSSDSDPTTRFSLGTRVAQNLFVIYSTALNGDQQRGIVNFEPNSPFWLRYIVEDDGRNMIEVNHRLGIKLRPKQSDPQSESEDPGRISTVSFEGESPLKAKELQKLSRLKPGKDFDYWSALDGADRIQKRLVKLGYRGALVEFEDRSSVSGQIEAVYVLQTGKKIHVVWSGDPVKRSLRKEIEALWGGRTPEIDLPEILARQTAYAMKADKYFLAEVSSYVAETGIETTVQLNVKKGAQGEKVNVQFDGNESLPDSALEEALPDPGSADFFEKIDRYVGMIRRDIHLLYASHGFIKAKVTKFHTGYLAENREFLVKISVGEGEQALVDSVAFPADAAENTDTDGPALSLKPDQPFQLNDYMNDRTELRRFYSQQGFFQPRVTGMLRPVADKIAVSFAVSKGPQARVGKIRRARPGRTRISTIKNTLSLKEGDLILPSELSRSRQRFLDTRAFRAVDIRLEESEEGPHIQDLVVDLVDKPDIELNYGFRYTLPTPGTEELRSSPEYSAFEIGGRLEFLNPFGYGRRFGVSGYLFGVEQFIRLFVESESFFGHRIPTQIFLSHTWKPDLFVSGIQSRVNKITFQQYKRWRQASRSAGWVDKMRLLWNYSFRNIQISSTQTSQPSEESAPVGPVETYRGSVSLALFRDSRDSFVDPTRGFFGSISSEFANKWLGSDVNFNKLYLQGFFFVPLAKDVTWASGLRVGVIPGENPFLILEDRFRTGGPYSVRGFPIYHLGPKNKAGEPLGGQAIFVFNQELRFPLYKSLHAGIFYDTGNVFAFTQKMSFDKLRHCAGAGLRFILPFGPLRLDGAYVLDPKPEESRYQIFFTIGHVF